MQPEYVYSPYKMYIMRQIKQSNTYGKIYLIS